MSSAEFGFGKKNDYYLHRLRLVRGDSRHLGRAV